jgi:hypothetical protein
MRARSGIEYVRAVLIAALGVGIANCGGTSSSGIGGDGGAGSSGGSSSGGPSSCANPTPQVLNGQPTGYDQCDGGILRRRGPATCPNGLPRAGGGVCTQNGGIDAGVSGSCSSDADCTAQPNGYCQAPSGKGFCSCSYGCTKDSDCAAGKVCVCGTPVGQCVDATCTDGTACPGSDCLSYKTNNCGGTGFSCLSSKDACLVDKDCAVVDAGGGIGEPTYCGYASGARVCQLNGPCGTGRPFLVAGDARVAPTLASTEWLADPSPSLEGLGLDARRERAERWTKIGQMEHASIAAFARFALELMALGAPASLLAETAAAMNDEIEHARAAFALASAYAGRPIGPGSLAVDGCLAPMPTTGALREAMIANLVREGCVGETLAAIEAHDDAGVETDPAVAHVLRRVAEDEARHASLAWRTLAWALHGWGKAARPAILRELEAAIEERADMSPAAVDGVLRPALAAMRIDPDATSRDPLALQRRELPCRKAEQSVRST